MLIYFANTKIFDTINNVKIVTWINLFKLLWV